MDRKAQNPVCYFKDPKMDPKIHVQFKISDNQALFWCFVLILKMTSLETLFLYSVG